MKPLNTIILTSVLFLLHFSGIYSQNLTIQTTVTPPVPITAADIENAEDDLVLFSVFNPGEETSVRLSIKIENHSMEHPFVRSLCEHKQ